MVQKILNICLTLTLLILVIGCMEKNKSEKHDNVIERRLETQPNNTSKLKEVWKFKKVLGKEVLFENGQRLSTDLFNLQYIGQLQTLSSPPFLILAGRTCTECDENLSIYIHSPSNGPLKGLTTQRRYDYPTVEYDYADNSILFQARMFYGNCLPNQQSCAVWIQKEKVKNGQFSQSLFLVEVQNDTLKETKLMYNDSLARIFSNNCKELQGTRTTSEP